MSVVQLMHIKYCLSCISTTNCPDGASFAMWHFMHTFSFVKSSMVLVIYSKCHDFSNWPSVCFAFGGVQSLPNPFSMISRSLFNDRQIVNITRYRKYSYITVPPSNEANDSPIKCIAFTSNCTPPLRMSYYVSVTSLPSSSLKVSSSFLVSVRPRI